MLNIYIFILLTNYIVCYVTCSGADLVNWGPQANIRMGPYTFAHIYLDQPWGSFFVMMHNSVESNVSTFFMYML